MGRTYSMYGKIQKCRVLVGKPERKGPLGRPRHRWKDNIKMNLKEVGCDPDDLVALA